MPATLTEINLERALARACVRFCLLPRRADVFGGVYMFVCVWCVVYSRVFGGLHGSQTAMPNVNQMCGGSLWVYAFCIVFSVYLLLWYIIKYSICTHNIYTQTHSHDDSVCVRCRRRRCALGKFVWILCAHI